ncbi:MAG: F0F1 ATP synthase subunit B [Actinomycetota bacterium]|nr:F0F1 ATP synthase subunit B [Actinomycetota bacterium]
MPSTISGAVLLAQESGGHSGTDLVLPALPELIWGAVSFVVVAFVLSRIAFPRLRESVEQRERSIREKQEEAEQARQDAQNEKEQYEKQRADARSEANRIVEEARGSAEQVRKDTIAKAEKEAEAIVDRSREQIDSERTRAMQELQGTVANLSIELAEKVVGRSLDGPSQRELVDAYIKEVSGMPGSGGSSA